MSGQVTRQSAINLIGGVLSIFIAGCLAYSLYALVNREIPNSNRDAFMVILGLIGGNINTIFNWFFGSSQDSKKQTEAIASQAETIKTAQAALTPNVNTVPIAPGETVTVEGTGNGQAQ